MEHRWSWPHPSNQTRWSFCEVIAAITNWGTCKKKRVNPWNCLFVWWFGMVWFSIMSKTLHLDSTHKKWEWNLQTWETTFDGFSLLFFGPPPERIFLGLRGTIVARYPLVKLVVLFRYHFGRLKNCHTGHVKALRPLRANWSFRRGNASRTGGYSRYVDPRECNSLIQVF